MSRIFPVTKVLHSEYCGALLNHELQWHEIYGSGLCSKRVLYVILPLVDIELFWWVHAFLALH
jgi:hypothetical protein